MKLLLVLDAFTSFLEALRLYLSPSLPASPEDGENEEEVTKEK